MAEYRYTECANFRAELAEFKPEVMVSGTMSQDDKKKILGMIQRHGITLTEFRVLDGKPGRFTESNWHWKLRQVRNDPRISLFEILNKNEDEEDERGKDRAKAG